MTLSVGDRLPEASFMTMTADGPTKLTTDDVFKGKTVALFAVPGAFTPTCSAKHLPGFVEKADEIRAKGVDTIACLSVNDAFVMGAWGKDQNVGDTVRILALLYRLQLLKLLGVCNQPPRAAEPSHGPA